MRASKTFLLPTIGLAIALTAAHSHVAADTPSPRPNVVLILTDNLGYADLGCYGARDLHTPNIDRLASQGVRFTQFYSNAPDCSPARTALLTGRYQQRVGGLEFAIGVGNVGRYDDAARLAAQHDLGLPTSETTIVRLLKQAGYQTAGFGKWHLGYEKKFYPPHHGFDHYLGTLSGCVDYFFHHDPSGINIPSHGTMLSGSQLWHIAADCCLLGTKGVPTRSFSMQSSIGTKERGSPNG